MRKIILIAAMVLASASAQAAERSLSLSTATAAPQTTSQTTQISEVAPAVEAPKYVDRRPAIPAAPPAVAPAPVTTTTSAAGTTSAAPAAQPASKSTAKADKPRHKRYWTEGRIIAELHRHGVYW